MAVARRVDQPKRKTRSASERPGRRSNGADALTAAPLGQFKDHFREFLDRALGLAWTANADGAHQLVNRRWVEYTGDLAEGEEGSWRALHPEDLRRMPDTWTALRRAQGPGDFEARLKRLDGVFRWFLFHAEPHCGPDGALVGWYGTATDIEDRKRTQSLRAAEMRTLQMITDGASLSEILNQLCAAIDCQVSPSRTMILLLDPDGKWLSRGAGPKISPEWMR